jgi:hypothetical protein
MLFTLDWLLDKDLRQRVTAGLNKGNSKIRWPSGCWGATEQLWNAFVPLLPNTQSRKTK